METVTWITVALAIVTMVSNGWDRWVRYREMALDKVAEMVQVKVELKECKDDREALWAELGVVKKQVADK